MTMHTLHASRSDRVWHAMARHVARCVLRDATSGSIRAYRVQDTRYTTHATRRAPFFSARSTYATRGAANS
eukprot:31318-Lingulodinium_polyedra.AAC.1